MWKQGWALFSWFPKSLQMVTAAMKLKDNCSLEEKLWQTFSILKSRHITLLTKVHIVKAAMAPHSSVLAWRIPGTGEPGGLPSMGLHRVGHDWSALATSNNGFSSSHVWMWELGYKEGWVPKNWCFWTVVLEKILESFSDCKEIKSVNSKETWIFIGRTGAEAPNLWPLDA